MLIKETKTCTYTPCHKLKLAATSMCKYDIYVTSTYLDKIYVYNGKDIFTLEGTVFARPNLLKLILHRLSIFN